MRKETSGELAWPWTRPELTEPVPRAHGISALFMGEEFRKNKNCSDNRGGNGLIW